MIVLTVSKTSDWQDGLGNCRLHVRFDGGAVDSGDGGGGVS